MRFSILSALVIFCAAAGAHAASDERANSVDAEIERVIRPLMAEHGIPGMAVAVTAGGKDHVRHFGVASKESRRPVTGDTLFEIGSISKTFTATLAALAEANGKLSLSDSTAKHLPALRGTAFDKITLLHLAAHTGGGLPLQVPESVTGPESLHQYLAGWEPAHAPGTRRVYSNPGIGVLGMAVAAAMREPFEPAVENLVLRPLGMRSTFYQVPPDRMQDYAQGYNRKDVPIRMSPGVFAAEAYGLRSTAADMLRFIKANMASGRTDQGLREAMQAAQRPYFESGELRQGLVWEQYPWPVTLERLQAGNADRMVYQAVEAVAVDPGKQASDILVNKTGSTNGFAAYVAFVPSRGIGVLMLANKNYPAAARISAAHRILSTLHARSAGGGR